MDEVVFKGLYVASEGVCPSFVATDVAILRSDQSRSCASAVRKIRIVSPRKPCKCRTNGSLYVFN